jgi:hypothetical protein
MVSCAAFERSIRMAQASRSVTVNVPPEKLFDVIADYEK